MPSRYPDESKVTGYICPKCGSTDVSCTNAFYEFSTMKCNHCKFSESVDDWEIADWISSVTNTESIEIQEYKKDQCASCNAKEDYFSIREPYVINKDFDEKQGLISLNNFSEGLLKCPICSTVYRYNLESSSMFHDYDEHYFSKLNLETSQFINLLSKEYIDIEEILKLDKTKKVSYPIIKSNSNFSETLINKLSMVLNKYKNILSKLL